MESIFLSGLRFVLLERKVFGMKKWFENFLKKLEEANKKNLGSERLDCCRLNSGDKPQKPSQSK